MTVSPETSRKDDDSSESSSSSDTDALSSLSSSITRIFQKDEAQEEDEAVKVGLFWDEWARCIGSGYQSDSLYRHGKLDNCGRQWRDFKLAAEARLTQWRNPERAKELIESTYYFKRKTISPTAGAIWELKERPGWE